MGRMYTDDADIMRAVGLTVKEWPGWKTNADYSDGTTSYNPIASIFHHDGMGLGFNDNPNDDENVPAYMSGSGVGGAQKWARKDGVIYCLAAGRKWHAGVGDGWGPIPANGGNTYSMGWETDHTFGDGWPEIQVTALALAMVAIHDARGWSRTNVCGHKEYAPGRKSDPESMDMDAFRTRLTRSILELQQDYVAAGGVLSNAIIAPKPPVPPVTRKVNNMLAIFTHPTNGGTGIANLWTREWYGISADQRDAAAAAGIPGIKITSINTVGKQITKPNNS